MATPRSSVLPLVLGSFFVLLGAAPAPAQACSQIGPTPFAPEAGVDGDVVAPTLDGELTVDVQRGDVFAGTSCADLGFLAFTFAPAVEDQPPAEDDAATENEWPGVGYLLTLEAGELPEGLTLAAEPVHAGKSGGDAVMSLVWVDGADAAQDALDFTLALTAVDAAGNVSEPVAIEVADAGGCASASARPAAGLLVLAGALAARRRGRA